MCHLVFVAIMHRIEQDEANITSFLFVVITFLDDPVEQFSTHHLFCDEVIILWLVEDVVQADDVLVLEFCKDCDFILQRNLILLGQFRFRNDLDSE